MAATAEGRRRRRAGLFFPQTLSTATKARNTAPSCSWSSFSSVTTTKPPPAGAAEEEDKEGKDEEEEEALPDEYHVILFVVWPHHYQKLEYTGLPYFSIIMTKICHDNSKSVRIFVECTRFFFLYTNISHYFFRV
jgi:hypothetical protein